MGIMLLSFGFEFTSGLALLLLRLKYLLIIHTILWYVFQRDISVTGYADSRQVGQVSSQYRQVQPASFNIQRIVIHK